MRLTLARVKKELTQNDTDALLARGTGYFYFWSGEAADWLDRTVQVERINDLSLDEWLVRFHELRRKNQQNHGSGEARAEDRWAASA